MNVLAAPNSLGDIRALQTHISQQAVIKLAELFFSSVASQVSFQRTHQARRCGNAMVADRLAAHADRRHCRRPSKNCAMHPLAAQICGGTTKNKRGFRTRVMRITHNSVHPRLTFARVPQITENTGFEGNTGQNSPQSLTSKSCRFSRYVAIHHLSHAKSFVNAGASHDQY
jgi:hypothetical protein